MKMLKNAIKYNIYLAVRIMPWNSVVSKCYPKTYTFRSQFSPTIVLFNTLYESLIDSIQIIIGPSVHICTEYSATCVILTPPKVLYESSFLYNPLFGHGSFTVLRVLYVFYVIRKIDGRVLSRCHCSPIEQCYTALYTF